MSDIAIKIDNISKRYLIGNDASGSLRETISGWFSNDHKKQTEEFWALKDLSFDIKKGEAVGIIGKNGAGKSTLLKILARITEPTTGRIEIDGRISSLLEVGTGFHPELTGRENVFLNGTVLGMSRNEVKAKFDEIVDFSGVEKFLDTPVKRYSSGMKVRLGFAVAAHLEPEILIIDEVLAVGDAEFQKKCLGKMQDVTGQGRTIFFVSHNMAAVSNLCTKGFLLKDGLVAYNGNVERTIEEYLLLNQIDSYGSLKDVKERSGSGQVIVTDIKFMDYNRREPTTNLIAGQDLVIEVSYESKPEVGPIINDLNLGISFFTRLDEFKTVLNSRMSSNAFRNVPSSGKVYCRVKKLPFMYGHLSGIVTLKKDSILADQIENAFSIYVESGDYYHTAKDNAFEREGIYVDHEWLTELT